MTVIDSPIRWRRREVLGLGLGAAALAMAGCSSASPARAQLNVGYGSRSYQSAAELLADDFGLYDKNGLQVKLVKFNGSSQVAAALKSGAIDIGCSDAQASAVGILGGIDLAYVGVNIAHYTLEMWARPPYTSIGEMRGKTFGTAQPGGLADVALTVALARHQMTRDDVKIISFNDPPAKNAALTAGAIDAQLEPPPGGGERLEAGGAKVIYDMSPIPNLTQAYVTTPTFIAEHPDRITAFLKATREADVRIKNEPDAVIPIIADYMSIHNEKHNRHGYDFHRGIYTIDPSIDPTLLDTAFGNAQQASGKQLPPDKTPASFYHDQFARGLIDEGFVQSSASQVV